MRCGAVMGYGIYRMSICGAGGLVRACHVLCHVPCNQQNVALNPAGGFRGRVSSSNRCRQIPCASHRPVSTDQL